MYKINLKDIVELTGEAGSAKTSLALHLVQNFFQPILSHDTQKHPEIPKILIIYTKTNFPFSRLTNSNKSLENLIFQNTFLFCSSDLMKLKSCLYEEIPSFLKENKNTKLIVIDSITDFFPNGDIISRSKAIFRLSSFLKKISYENDVPILVTNQVVDVFPGDILFRKSFKGSFETSGRRVKPALGLAWSNCVNCRLALSKLNGERRIEGIFNSSTQMSFDVKDNQIQFQN